MGYVKQGQGQYEIQSLSQVHVKELAAQSTQVQGFSIPDVRSPREWAKGHAPSAQHISLPDLSGGLETLDKTKPMAVYCDSGYRASIEASLLQSHGFEVSNVPGSWQAWKSNDLPVGLTEVAGKAG